MDEDDLREATDRWVEDGIIDEVTADAIVSYEGDRPDESTDRVSTIVAIMGALLIGVGLLAAIAAAWNTLDDITRSVLLVAAPILAGSAGIHLDRNRMSRPAIGLWLLSLLLVGPCLFLLADMHWPQLEAQWMFLVWGIVALPMGHAFRTRIGTAVGLGTLLLAIVLTGAEQGGLIAAGMMGSVIATVAIPLRNRVRTLVDTYRTVALIPTLTALIWIAVGVGIIEDLTIDLTVPVGGAFLLGLGAAGIAWWWQHTDRGVRSDAVLASIPIVAATIGFGIGLIGNQLPSLVAFLTVHVILLATLLATAWVGLRLASTWLVNLVALGFFVQVLTLLVRLTDDLSGALALIVGGVGLLLVAVGLERGRRRVLEQVRPSDLPKDGTD